MERTSGKILRAIRKYHGITQMDFCQILGFKQGTLSRLESDKLELSAYEWLMICSKYNLDPLTLQSGIIESFENIKISPESNEVVGNFKLANKYQLYMGSTNRTLFPFIRLMEENIGEEKTREFYKELGVDSDYFVIQNLPINIKIIEDTFNFLVKRGVISEKSINKIFQVTPTKDIHHLTIDLLAKTKDPELKFKKLTKIVHDHFEQNSLYKFEGHKNCYIQVRDNNFISELSLSSEFVNFREIYNTFHFNNLAPLFLAKHNFSSQKVSGGWNIAG